MAIFLDETLDKLTRAILEAAEQAAVYSHELWEEDEEVAEEAARLCNHLRDVATQVNPPNHDWPNNVVPFVPRDIKLKALPPDRGRV